MSNDQEKFGVIVLNELKKILPNTSKSTEPIEVPAAELTDSTEVHIDDIVFSSENDQVRQNIVDNIEPSSSLTRTFDQYVENFGRVEQQLISTATQISSSENTTTEQKLQPSTSRHIMISYNESSFEICHKICLGLRDLGYEVWMDEYSLHGRILHGMAEGIQNASIVLVCYNENYAKSDYCLQEAVYAFQKRIDFIPCRLQSSYRPDGWLGILICDRLYIDFSPPNTFESAFEKLVEEIKSIKTPSQTYACSSPMSPMSIQNENIREKFDTIIRTYKESLNKTDQDLQSLDKKELCELIVLLREQLCNNNNNQSASSTTQSSDQILKDLFQQSQNQTVLLSKISNILSQPTDIKTVAKLSLAVLFVWTVKTHIIDACLKIK